MTASALAHPAFARLRQFQRPTPANDGVAWRLPSLTGRLVELSAHGASGSLTFALCLVRDAQLAHETVAWVTPKGRSFYPPDAAQNGVDLAALPVVRVPKGDDVSRAAEVLVRSGAFSLVVLDLPEGTSLAPALATRLLGLAKQHSAAVVMLTEKTDAAPSQSSLVSLRATTKLVHRHRGTFACTLTVLKDKRNAPGWTHEEVCRGPLGMR